MKTTGRWMTALCFEDVGDIAGDGKWAKLTSPLRYKSSTGLPYFVPTGFETDFASIPRLLWTFVGSPASGKWRRAAVLHDYLYSNHVALGISRSTADGLFFEAMLASGVGKWKARQLWLGVRAGGWVAWSGYEK